MLLALLALALIALVLATPMIVRETARRRARRQAAKAARGGFDLPLYDHVVIVGDRYVSFATAGLL